MQQILSWSTMARTVLVFIWDMAMDHFRITQLTSLAMIQTHIQ